MFRENKTLAKRILSENEYIFHTGIDGSDLIAKIEENTIPLEKMWAEEVRRNNGNKNINLRMSNEYVFERSKILIRKTGEGINATFGEKSRKTFPHLTQGKILQLPIPQIFATTLHHPRSNNANPNQATQ